jgi:hypothetical protein
VHAAFDTVLDVDHARREHFGEVFGHAQAVDSRSNADSISFRELARIIDRDAARVL